MNLYKKTPEESTLADLDHLRNFMSDYLASLSHFGSVKHANNRLEVVGDRVNFDVFDARKVNNVISRLDNLKTETGSSEG